MKETKCNKKVLYITFIDFDGPSGSGSAVRPKRMYDAFVDIGCEVKLLSGRTSYRNCHRKERKRKIKEINLWLKENRPDCCYIEPPTGPLFFLCDRNLIRRIHHMGIPIGFFYRDIYWKFPGEGFSNSANGWGNTLKEFLVKCMQYRDFLMLKRCISRFYFVSSPVNRYMNLKSYGLLPPGCVDKHIAKAPHHKITGIYVGGATERYGIGLILESWKLVEELCSAQLIIVCPQKQWEEWIERHKEYRKLSEGIDVYHLSDGEKLNRLYEKSDFSLIPILKTAYNDMAIPIKLYEYLSCGLPIVATNCEEMKKIIEKNRIGIVSADDSRNFSEAILQMISNLQSDKKYYEEDIKKACKENLWTKRAETVIKDLVK